MLDNLIALDNVFQGYLRPNDYTFIGPSDERLLKVFINNANQFVPKKIFGRTIHYVLSNQYATRTAARLLPQNIQLKIYVVTRINNDNFLVRSTIEEYCQRFHIDFPYLNHEF